MLMVLNEFLIYAIKLVSMALFAFFGILAGKALYNKKKAKEANSESISEDNI